MPLALFFFTLPTFRSPLYNRYPTPYSLPLINLLGTPRPRCLVHPSPPAGASCANLVQSPTNLFVVEFFSAREEKLGNMASTVSTKGGIKESTILLLLVAPRRPIPDVHRRSRVSSFGRPRLHRRNKWTGQKGLGQRVTRIISMMALNSFNLSNLRFTLT